MWVSPKEIFHQNQRYRGDITIIEKNQKSWYKEHSMNYTGTEKSYSPRNSSSKKIRSVSKSYESWSPGERK